MHQDLFHGIFLVVNATTIAEPSIAVEFSGDQQSYHLKQAYISLLKYIYHIVS